MRARTVPTPRLPATASWPALVLSALALAGCGAVQVQATTPAGSARLASRGRVDSPLRDVRNHLGCLRDAHLPVQVLSPTELQVGPAAAGATIRFAPTPGAAQADQIQGKAQGAEVIGSALVYPHQASEAALARVAACLTQGVQG
jgi:hypothetical protein